MKTKSQPDVLQAWLATQDLPPLDRQYMKYAAANDNEVFKMVMGNHDWMVVTPCEAKNGWGKILNMRMVKTWSFAELCDSRIAPQNKPLQELPFQQKLTWRDGGSILLSMVLVFGAFYIWIRYFSASMELYVWLLGFYCCLTMLSTSAKWCRVLAQSMPLKPWQSWTVVAEQSLILKGALCLSLGYACSLWIFNPLIQLFERHYWPNSGFELVFASYVLFACGDKWLNRRLDARLLTAEHAQHYELWLYNRDGSRTCYARANERASLELLQHWLKAQQQRYFDAHPAQLAHTQLTGRL